MKIFFKKNVFLKKIPISIHYFIFSLAIITILGLLTFLILILDYQSAQKSFRNNLKNEAIHLENILSSTFRDIHATQLFMGQYISQYGATNLKYIAKLFQTYSASKSNIETTYPSGLYHWTDANMRLVVDSKLGNLYPKPFNLSHRDFLQKAKRYPWQLALSSSPIIGATSKQWVIVAATGINNVDERYLGAISVTLNIRELSQKLEQNQLQRHINFVMINTQGEVVLSSSDNELIPRSLFIKSTIDSFGTKPQGILANPIIVKNFSYQYFRKMHDYPFYIITGANNAIVWQNFLTRLPPRLLELGGVSTICILLILLFRQFFICPITLLSAQTQQLTKKNFKFTMPHFYTQEIYNLTKRLLQVRQLILRQKNMEKLLQLSNRALKETNHMLVLEKEKLETTQKELEKAIQIAKESDMAKERFMRQLDADLKVPLESILNNSSELIAHFYNTRSKTFSKNNYLTHLEHIYHSAVELKTLTRAIVNLKKIDIKILTDESIQILNKAIFTHQLSLIKEYACNLPVVYADPLRLKQIIVSLLYRAIENTPIQGMIHVAIQQILDEKTKTHWVKLTVQDSGFGLDEQARQRLKTKFLLNESSWGIELELEAIKSLVELHNGHFQINTQWGHGTQSIIFMPCVESLQEIKTTKNIYYFPSKMKK